MEKLRLFKGLDFFQVVPRISGLEFRSHVLLRAPPRITALRGSPELESVMGQGLGHLDSQPWALYVTSWLSMNAWDDF